MRYLLPDDKDVYFFDMFDTIVTRSVYPEYIKKLWAKELKMYLSIPNSYEEIYAFRNKIEAELCQESVNMGNDLEFSYRDMTERFHKLFRTGKNLEEFQDIAYDLELTIEKRFQKKCQGIDETLAFLKSQNKRIFCVSDFYMPKNFLYDLFCFHGLEQYFEDIFVSTDYKKTKRTGNLYDIVLKAISADSNVCLMIGDNYESDIQKAKEKGISGYYLDKEVEKKEKFQLEWYQSLQEKLKNYYAKLNRNDYEDVVFSLYLFVEKLYYYLKNRQVKNIFFMSREGEFLKKIFDFYKVYKKDEEIKSHYIIVSRKSTLLPSLKNIEEENFFMIFRQYVNISLFDFLKSIGFEDEEVGDISREINVEEKQIIEDFPNSLIFSKLKKNKLFLDRYEEKRISQKEAFGRYLSSFGVDFEKEGFHVVDVGWKGTIQDNIFNYYDKKISLYGYYLGLVANAYEQVGNNKIGLVFDCVNEQSRFFRVYNENRSIFEVLLAATHGSANYYFEKNGKMEVATCEQQEERKLFEQVVYPMLDHVYERFVMLTECLDVTCYNLQDLEVMTAKFHSRLVYFPTKKQINFFYNIYHYENFGVFQFSVFKQKEKILLNERVKNVVLMFRNRRKFFERTFWGIITLKNSGLSFLIKPYGIYMYRRFYKKEI